MNNTATHGTAPARHTSAAPSDYGYCRILQADDGQHVLTLFAGWLIVEEITTRDPVIADAILASWVSRGLVR